MNELGPGGQTLDTQALDAQTLDAQPVQVAVLAIPA